MTRDKLEGLRTDTVSTFKRERWVTLEEAHILDELVKEEAPDYIFESGTANGYSACWMGVDGIPVTTYDIVDRPKVWGGTPPANITCVVASFDNAVEDILSAKGKKLFFIDGRHTVGGVLKDIATVLKGISPGDVIVFHDAFHRAVNAGINSVRDRASSCKMYDTPRGVCKLIWKGEENEQAT